MPGKYLMNIRGASASGKTTAVKQFLDKHGFSVVRIKTPFRERPVCLLNDSSIVVLGDYTESGNCLGVDRFKGSIVGDITDCIISVADTYKPDIIVYEHMLSSQLFKSTHEIATVAKQFGYDFMAVQLYLSDEERKRRLMQRSGENAGLKNFDRAKKRVDSASQKLAEFGYKVIRVNVEEMNRENMWKVVEYGIRQAVK